MSISSEITRISDNVSSALDAVESKGVTIPTGANSDDLPALISSIRTGSSVVVTPTLLTGTDIASISVDGSSTTLYAPTPPTPSSATPQDLGTASSGSSTDYSRADHVHAKPSYSKSDVGLGNVDNVQQYSASNPPPYPVTSVNGETGQVTLTASDVNAIPAPASASSDNVLAYNGSAWVPDKRTVILSYGHSTWSQFLSAYNSNAVIYCRASSNSNPASGSQTRMAFMAYVNNADNPTNVEFQYYRSVNQHSATQQGDQVYVYKLDYTAGWTVTVRENYTKIVAGSGLSSAYSNSTITLTNSAAVPSGGTAGQFLRKSSSTDYATEWSDDTGGVTSVNGMTGDVTVSTIAVQDNAPSGGELVWIDTDEPGQSITIPQINDNSISADDTWSSQKISSEISSGGGGGTTVVANPALAGTEDSLTGLQVGNTKYSVLNIMWLTESGDNLALDKTWQEIYDALMGGALIYVKQVDPYSASVSLVQITEAWNDPNTEYMCVRASTVTWYAATVNDYPVQYT